MNSGMWGIGFALVDMRQRKLLKRFVATPMRRIDFLLALAQQPAGTDDHRSWRCCWRLACWYFICAWKARCLSILLVGALGAVSFGGIGLLTASRAQKIESVSGLINLVMMPMWIFSGVFFSYERFPKIVLPAIRALPLTALNDALRAIILQGAPLRSQLGRIAVLVAVGRHLVRSGIALVPLELSRGRGAVPVRLRITAAGRVNRTTIVVLLCAMTQG